MPGAGLAGAKLAARGPDLPPLPETARPQGMTTCRLQRANADRPYTGTSDRQWVIVVGDRMRVCHPQDEITVRVVPKTRLPTSRPD